jgi:hypothetical protein
VSRSPRYVLDTADELAPGLVNHLRLSVRDIDASGRCYAVFFRDPDGVKLEVLHVRR